MIPPIRRDGKPQAIARRPGRGRDVWYASLSNQLPSFGPAKPAASNVVPLAKR
jgi:hypothetical protein